MNIRDWLEADMVVFEEPSYDEAIIGTTHDRRVVYDYYIMCHCLTERDGMTEEEAAEFVDYNAARAIPYIENGPVIMYPSEARYEVIGPNWIEAKEGSWKHRHNGVYCTSCGKQNLQNVKTPFCPHCGARMKGVADETD